MSESAQKYKDNCRVIIEGQDEQQEENIKQLIVCKVDQEDSFNTYYLRSKNNPSQIQEVTRIKKEARGLESWLKLTLLEDGKEEVMKILYSFNIKGELNLKKDCTVEDNIKIVCKGDGGSLDKVLGHLGW